MLPVIRMLGDLAISPDLRVSRYFLAIHFLCVVLLWPPIVNRCPGLVRFLLFENEAGRLFFMVMLLSPVTMIFVVARLDERPTWFKVSLYLADLFLTIMQIFPLFVMVLVRAA